MTPILIAFYEGKPYARMARVLAHTAALHCPEWDRRIQSEHLGVFHRGDKAQKTAVRKNVSKLWRWIEAVDSAPDGTPMLLVDADVMILRPLDDIWDLNFDVAYTVRDRERSHIPLNAGVIFVRANENSRAFLRAWHETTLPFRNDKALFAQAVRLFGACDQAGLAKLLRQPWTFQAAIRALPCQEWNCEDSEWQRFGSNTRIVHIKGSLRKAIFKRPISAGRKPSVLPLARRWADFESQAGAS